MDANCSVEWRFYQDLTWRDMSSMRDVLRDACTQVHPVSIVCVVAGIMLDWRWFYDLIVFVKDLMVFPYVMGGQYAAVALVLHGSLVLSVLAEVIVRVYADEHRYILLSNWHWGLVEAPLAEIAHLLPFEEVPQGA